MTKLRVNQGRFLLRFCRSRLLPAGLAAAIVLLAMPTVAQAQVTNRRTRATFPTIQAAINAAAPGDVLLVAPGNYPENVLVNKAVRLLGQRAGARPTINPPAGTAIIVLPVMGTPFIDGLDLQVVDGPMPDFGVLAYGPVIIENCRIFGGDVGIFTLSNATINSNTVLHYDQVGILADGPVGNAEIPEELPSETPAFVEELVVEAQDRVAEAQALISEVQSPGVRLLGGPGVSVQIHNNIVDSFSTPGTVGILSFVLGDARVTYNTVRNHPDRGIGIFFFRVATSALFGNRVEENTIGFLSLLSVVDADNNVIQNSPGFKTTENNVYGRRTFGELYLFLSAGTVNIADTVRGFDEGILTFLLSAVIINNSVVENNHAAPMFPFLGCGIDFLFLGFGAVTNSLISGNDMGVGVRFLSRATVNNNCIAGNATAGLRELMCLFPPLDARNNFWGAADGPSGDGPGSGDAVLSTTGVEVNFTPFVTGCDPRNGTGGRGDRGPGGSGRR